MLLPVSKRFLQPFYLSSQNGWSTIPICLFPQRVETKFTQSSTNSFSTSERLRSRTSHLSLNSSRSLKSFPEPRTSSWPVGTIETRDPTLNKVHEAYAKKLILSIVDKPQTKSRSSITTTPANSSGVLGTRYGRYKEAGKKGVKTSCSPPSSKGPRLGEPPLTEVDELSPDPSWQRNEKVKVPE